MDQLQRLTADRPDWMFRRSRDERYWIATYRRHIHIKGLLSAATPLRKQPRGIGS
jgi:hypothetical protein